MGLTRVVAICSIAGLFSFASGATLSGRVIDNSAAAVPIANASVSLKANGASTFSGATGLFALTFSSAGTTQTNGTKNSILRFYGDKLCFSAAAHEHVRIDIFDMAGQKVGALAEDRVFGAGSHSLSLSAVMRKNTVPGLYLARITKGMTTFSGAFLSMGATGGVVASDFGGPDPGKFALAKTSASPDSLIVYRMGYDPKAISIADITAQSLGDIVLARTAAEVVIEHKIDSLLALMNINDKAGQMVQTQISSGSMADRLTDAQYASLGVGSVFNGGSDPSAPANTPEAWAAVIDRVQNAIMNNSKLKIPMIYGQDCVHGAAEVAGCTVFPHEIGLGCTHDSALVAQIGRDVAEESAGMGIRLTFAPCVASVRNERWGRTYEGFGETPELNIQMGAAYVRGLQGDGDIGQIGAISASAKHYLGDGATTNGVNNGNATVSTATMQAVHFPQYAACARQNVGVVMISFSTWTHDGQKWPQATDFYALTTLLKGQAGFDGICLSDWDGLLMACGDYSTNCVASAIKAGMDMFMIVGNENPINFINAVVDGVNGAAIPIARVNDAVRRILRLKLRMHLWDHPLSNATFRGQIFSSTHRADARRAVRESLVLLKNEDNALPLLKTEKIVVVGPFADNIGAQCGGWTISWQGQLGAGPGIAGQTILAGLTAAGGQNVTYSPDAIAISGADKIVAVIGEKPYAEGSGDVTVPDLTQCPNFSLVQTCVSSGKPVVLVMLTGRPMLLNSQTTSCKAIVEAWLPGSEGGGVADVLYGGTYNFTGKLTHTWPASAAQIPINTGPIYSDEQHGAGGDPMFAFGFGLHY